MRRFLQAGDFLPAVMFVLKYALRLAAGRGDGRNGVAFNADGCDCQA
jgi:hypothetical protein